MKKALITGITGQDGSYLAEFLLSKGYEVHGIKRRTSSINTERIDHLYRDPHDEDQTGLYLHFGDMNDASSLSNVIRQVEPDEIYNLAAQSHVGVSFEKPEYTASSDALGVLRILECLRTFGLGDRTRFYQASTSELYGLVRESPQNESTPFHPRSPYGVAKLYAYWITVNYREAFGMYACNGILFNHESPRRGENFVTRKITRALANLATGGDVALYLGNLDARRDWGHARDYVRMMWMMLQQAEPRDYVAASGEQHSVREFVTLAAAELGIVLEWEGEGINEIGRVVDFIALPEYVVNATPIEALRGKVIVRVDPVYFRPAEVDSLLGDASLARRELGWEPATRFESLVAEMTRSDYEKMASQRLLRDASASLSLVNP